MSHELGLVATLACPAAFLRCPEMCIRDSPNGNGTTTVGAALAVAQHTTKLPITVNIENGNLSGASALVANNPEKNDEEAIEKVNVYIENGQFDGLVATNDGGKIEVAGGIFDNLDKSIDAVSYTHLSDKQARIWRNS